MATRAAAVSSLRRSAGRSGVRLHPYRDDLVALVDSRLDDPRAPPPQPVPDPPDRAGRRRDDVRGRDASVRGAVRDPGAADRRARFSLPSRRDRRLGDELHRRCRGSDRRSPRRSAGAPEDAGVRSGGAAGRRRARAAIAASRPNCTKRRSWPRRLSHRDARAAGADRGRGRADGGEPRAGSGTSTRRRPTPPSTRCASWSRSTSSRSGSSRSMPTSSR